MCWGLGVVVVDACTPQIGRKREAYASSDLMGLQGWIIVRLPVVKYRLNAGEGHVWGLGLWKTRAAQEAFVGSQNSAN